MQAPTIGIPTSPAMPTILGGWGRKGSDFDLSAIMTMVLEFLGKTCPPMNAETVASVVRPTTIWSIILNVFW